MYPKKLTVKYLAKILNVAPITVSRISLTDEKFPELTKVGRSVFVDEDSFYHWLSLKAGKAITADDNLLKTKNVLDYYDKSTTWLWQMVKSGDIQEPFKINRTNFWLEREVIELSQSASNG